MKYNAHVFLPGSAKGTIEVTQNAQFILRGLIERSGSCVYLTFLYPWLKPYFYMQENRKSSNLGVIWCQKYATKPKISQSWNYIMPKTRPPSHISLNNFNHRTPLFIQRHPKNALFLISRSSVAGTLGVCSEVIPLYTNHCMKSSFHDFVYITINSQIFQIWECKGQKRKIPNLKT